MDRVRWRRPTPAELPTIEQRLVTWPCEVGGSVRHMFVLACLETSGVDIVRVATDHHGGWALALLHPGRLLVACGDASVVAKAGVPSRRWRLMVGDAPPSDAVIESLGQQSSIKIHHQRYFTLDPDRLPSEAELPNPGIRRAVKDDLPVLADLAVQLHLDDEFGPAPGARGRKSYLERLSRSIDAGLVDVVGPIGRPVIKVERAVASRRWGVQLAGIVASPDARAQGLGRSAVAAVVRQAMARDARRPVALHVRAANTQAIRAYEAAGFENKEEWRLVLRW